MSMHTRIVITFLLVCLFHTALNAKTPIIPVKQLFKFPEVHSLRISPTGEYFAAKAKIKGKATLVILERETLAVKYVFNFGDNKRDEIGRFGWLNDERIWATKVYKAGPLAEPRRTGKLFAGNVDGSKLRQLLPAKKTNSRKGSRWPKRFNFVDMLPHDPKNVIISKGAGEFSEAIRLNVYSGHQKKLARSPGPGASFLTNLDGKVSLSVSRSQHHQTVQVYLRKKEKWELIDSRSEKEGSFYPINYSQDNENIYLRVGNGKTPGIYLYNPNTAEKTLLKETKGDADIIDFIYDSNYLKPNLIGFKREPGEIITEFLNKDDSSVILHNELAALFPKQHLTIINYTKDEKIALLHLKNDRNPGSYYLYDRQKGQVSPIIDVRQKIDRNLMAERKPISFRARDGLEIRGYLTLPNDAKKNLPFVLLVHGGPYGVSDHWGFDIEAQFLANRGYAVLQVNYRGSGGRGKSFQYDHYREVGGKMQDDLTDATLWAVKQGIADKNKLCIYGASYGGYAALMGAVKEPELYKCAIGYAGVYDIEIQTTDSDTVKYWRYGKRFLDIAWNAYDDDFVKERSSVYHLNKLKAALFLIHGEDDPRTPYTQYEALTEALDDIKYPYESLVKDFEGHGFGEQKNVIELYEKMEKFLAKHLKN